MKKGYYKLSIFLFMLPEEKVEYDFQVNGIWDSTHNVSKIFKVYID